MRVTRHAYEVDGWGVGELWLGDDQVVLAHDPPTPGVKAAEAGAPAGSLAADLLERLQRYFGGEPVSFADVPLEEDWGTPFGAALAAALRGVGWGRVVSYGELSALAGRARAARAAGTFCAENRYSLFVPCHRVVSAGGLGGYGALGVAYKQRLLSLEGWVPPAAL
jgi:methylated-DNA-[protein]-cysteine S-methyltransferase